MNLLLWRLGHIPQAKSIGEAAELLAGPFGNTEAVRSYQAFHGLDQSGFFDHATNHHIHLPRCGHPDVMPATASVCKWPIKDLTYYEDIQYPHFDAAFVRSCYDEAWGYWAAVCGIQPRSVSLPGDARVVAISAPVDGPGNVLALSELPCGYGPSSVAHQTFDPADAGTYLNTRELIVACMCHEIGHALGLSHAKPGSGCLMEPVINPAIIKPQDGDIVFVQALYGLPLQPAPSPPPAAQPPPPAVPVGPRVEPISFDLDIPIAGTYKVTIGPTS